LLSVDDLCELLDLEIARIADLTGTTYNVGGGAERSLSLCETTALCQQITGRHIEIRGHPENRPGDVRVYVTDNSRVAEQTGWRPRRSARESLEAIHRWIGSHEPLVRHLWEN
jgi:CDP-paratose 2-epimerase